MNMTFFFMFSTPIMQYPYLEFFKIVSLFLKNPITTIMAAMIIAIIIHIAAFLNPIIQSSNSTPIETIKRILERFL